jgi:predicted kinase
MERTGDYAGIRVLRYYLVYRAMVRAKIARLRAAQAQAGTSACDRAVAESDGYLVLAAALAGPARPSIVLMHGLSGSGKSTVAQALLEEIGAVRVRSDVERKRLHGLAAMTRTHAQPFAGIYSADDSRRTYERLEQVARDVAAAGYCIIIDAAFLQHAARERFRAVAGELGVPFLIVSCRASEETLRVRLLRREAANDDASEAGVAVLAGQLATQEPLDAVELANTVLIESEWDACRLCRAFDEVAARLSVVP